MHATFAEPVENNLYQFRNILTHEEQEIKEKPMKKA